MITTRTQTTTTVQQRARRFHATRPAAATGSVGRALLRAIGEDWTNATR